MTRHIFVSVLALASLFLAGCKQSDKFKTHAETWLIHSEGAPNSLNLRLLQAAQFIKPDELLSKDEIARIWAVIDESTGNQWLATSATQIRASFNQIGQPPSEFRDTYADMQQFTRLIEEAVVYEMNHRDDPREVYATVKPMTDRAEQLLAVIRLRLGK
jgi:hypothetical protein